MSDASEAVIASGGDPVSSVDAMPPDALLIVRNPFTHDARVLRAAHALEGLGYRPAVVAVVSTTVRARRLVVDGVPVIRLAPSSPFSWIRSRLGRAGARHTAGADAAGPAARAPSAGMRPAIRLHRWLRTLDFYRRAIGVVLRERPRLVHCNDYNTMWVGAAARLLTDATVIYDSHELWADRNGRPEPRWWLLACEALLVRCAHEVVAASPGYADVMARRYRIDRPIVVRNIPSAAGGSPPRGGTPGGMVIYAGGLTHHRGLEQVVAALPRLPAHVTLRLMGPSSEGYLDELLGHAERLAVADRVEVAETVAPGEVISALAAADVGVAMFQPNCLSHRLVAPNKLFEYMAAGIPALGSDLPVIRDFLEEWGFGATARAEDPADIAARIEELLDPARNAACREAARRAAKVVTWENERKELERAYREATAR